MARIRSVKPEFWSSPDIAALSVTTRLVFIGLWNFAEDNGVGLADDRALRSQLFPMDDVDEASANVRRALGELSRGGQIALFEARGRRLYKINGWHHQKIDKPNRNPRYLTPEQYGDDAVSCGDTPFGDRSSNTPRTVDEASRPRARTRDQGEEGIGGDRRSTSAAWQVDLTSAREDHDEGRRAATIVDRHLLPGTSAGDRGQLAHHAATALAEGAATAPVDEAVAEWFTRDNCSPGFLPSLITNAVKRAHGAQAPTRTQVATTTSRVNGALALLRPEDDDEPPPHQLPPGKIS